MSSETFISRWSRRKQADRAAEPPDEALVSAAEAPKAQAPDRVIPDKEPARLPISEAELSADEIAALPPLEELTAESDVTLFLRRGVPEPLRNAALRRMWSL